MVELTKKRKRKDGAKRRERISRENTRKTELRENWIKENMA